MTSGKSSRWSGREPAIAGTRARSCAHEYWKDIRNTAGGDYRRCLTCGLEEQASLHDAETRFAEAQSAWYGSEGPACLTPFALALSANDAGYRSRILTRVAPLGTLLEVGPGSGQFAASAMSAGYDVTAIEDSDVLAEASRARGVAVRRGTFETTDLAPASFDTTVSWHVIEHVLDPVEFLRQAAQVTKPGGILILGTPNAASVDHRITGRLSPNYSFPHLRLFTPTSLDMTLRASGWVPIERFTTEEPEHWLKVAAGLARAVVRRQDRAGADANDPPPLAVQSIGASSGMTAIKVTGVLSWLPRALQVRLDRGNELVMIARREADASAETRDRESGEAKPDDLSLPSRTS